MFIIFLFFSKPYVLNTIKKSISSLQNSSENILKIHSLKKLDSEFLNIIDTKLY